MRERGDGSQETGVRSPEKEVARAGGERESRPPGRHARALLFDCRHSDSCLLTSVSMVPGIHRVPPGKGAAEGVSRVLRGGSWNNDNSNNFRCAYRNNNRPDNRNNNNGFRCASTLRAGARTSTEAGARQRESRLLPGWPETDGRIHKRDRGLVAGTANVTRSWGAGVRSAARRRRFRAAQPGIWRQAPPGPPPPPAPRGESFWGSP